MQTRETDQKIIELKNRGETATNIALWLDVSRKHVMAICLADKAKHDLPLGVSRATAIDVHKTTGIWPSPEAARDIVERLMDISSNARSLKTMRELGHGSRV